MAEAVIQHSIDIIFLLVVIISAFIGSRRGTAGMIIAAVSAIAAFAAAKIFAPDIAQRLYESFLEPNITKALAENIEEASATGTGALVSAIPSYITSAAQSMNVDIASLISGLAENSGFDSSQLAESIVNSIAEPVTIPAVKFVVFTLGTIILFTLLRTLLSPLKAISKLPLLKQLNRSVGFLLGVIKGLFIDFAAACVAIAASSFMQGSAFSTLVSSSYFVGFIESVLKL